ncbi:MAG: hypothetical protein ABSC51_01205 [Gaiellaceae bacterium]|jgi:hypothetical protein
MYLKPATNAGIRFGDILQAEWLFDAWLESDAVRIGPFFAKGGNTGYGAHVARDIEEEFALAHSRIPKAMLVVNDDCYLETVLVRHKHGRVHLAPIFDFTEASEDPEAPEVPEERDESLAIVAFSRFPMPMQGNFTGGIAELRYATGVSVKNARMAKELKRARILRLDHALVTHLEARWGAHSSRRGPVVAANAAEKLAALLGSVNTSTSDTVKLVLSTTWSVEGAIPDLIDEAEEAARNGKPVDPDILLQKIEIRLQKLAEAAADAQRATAVSRALLAH